MKLYYSAGSPFVRKVLVTAIECGFKDQLTLLPTNPHQSPPEFVALNPFSKVPTLVLHDGTVLFESLLICEYLDDLAGGGVVLPRSRAQRWQVLRKHALGNGLMEASVLRRVESLRAKETDREKNLARQIAVTQRALDSISAGAQTLGAELELGNLSIAIALGYLDFRFPADCWREGRSQLALWFEQYSTRSSLLATVPHDPR